MCAISRILTVKFRLVKNIRTRLSLDADRVQALSYASVLADMYHAYYKYDGNLSYPLYLLRSYLREI